MELRAWSERIRGSLFYTPSLFVVVSGLLAWGVIRLDALLAGALDGFPLLLSVTVDSARSILGTIAGATITVAGIVFSVTVVSVQLASSQFSPRVLRGFLRDRFQQSVIGLVVGTFTYCMFVLATTRVSGPQPELTAAPSLAVTVAIVLAVGAILAIIAFIDHSARSMQAGEIIRRVTRETRGRIAALYPERDEERGYTELPGSPPPVDTERRVVRSWTDGWLQQFSPDTLLRSTPPGSYLRLETRVGAFVIEDTPLVTVWADDHTDIADVRGAFVIGGSRTMQQDVMFGIRQLVDIGLRALSLGINDPTTAHEVIVHLGAVLADVLQRDLPRRVIADDDGRLLVITTGFDHADHIDHAFDQLRVAAAAQPAVLIRLLRTLHTLDTLVVDHDLEHLRPPLHRQAARIVETAEHADLVPSDLARVCAVAHDLDLVDDDPGAPQEAHGAR